MSKATFIEHFVAENRFITDIWYHNTSKKYRSVVTDISYPKGYDTLAEITSALNNIKEVK